jgi:tetratricopeptide (TPR) repeat protein
MEFYSASILASILVDLGGGGRETLYVFDLGKYDEAIEAWDEAIWLDPNYEKAWNNKGNAFAALGKYDDAKSKPTMKPLGSIQTMPSLEQQGRFSRSPGHVR